MTPSFSPEIDPQLVNLIERLLIKNPRQRIGSGAFGSNNDARAIMGHKLFQGVEFSSINMAASPLNTKIKTKKQT